MAVFVESPRNAAWLISEANGSRSREVVRLAAGHKYLTGSLVGDNGALITDAATKASIVYMTIDATDGAVDATVIARDAEVIGELLVLPAGVSLAEATAILAATGIIVR